MKIAFTGNFKTGWDGSICDEEHIAKSLESMGHTVFRLQREEFHKVPAADMSLVAQWDQYRDLSSLPRPIVYWAFDFQADGQEWHQRLVDLADLYLSKAISDSKYPNWRWLSQDFAPEFLNRDELTTKSIDVLFTGTFLPWAADRIKFLRAVDDNFNLVIHSVNSSEWIRAGFKNAHGPLMDQELPALYGSAKVNISVDHTITAGYWSDRNAQIMACGGFVLFRYVPMSEVRFQDYVAYFNDIPHCLASIKYFLEHDDEREEIADYGYRYARNNLMVHHRVRDLLLILENL